MSSGQSHFFNRVVLGSIPGAPTNFKWLAEVSRAGKPRITTGGTTERVTVPAIPTYLMQTGLSPRGQGGTMAGDSRQLCPMDTNQPVQVIVKERVAVQQVTP